MPCLRYLMAVCALCLPLSALAAGVPEARFFSQDASDYTLAAETIGHGAPHAALDTALDAAESEIREAERLRASSPGTAFGQAKRAMFHCIYAWMLIQKAGRSAAPEQNGRARESLGRIRAFFEWDKPSLDRMAARTGGVLQEVLTAREAREIVSQGIDPREAAAARALEK
ncbi:MAG: hypothetical protein LBC79_09595 [Deltaproteobacteria bacterium]|jgi:hypothetical protein|nr:hypothetical protein [Deltaproteobacteria bacterium]